MRVSFCFPHPFEEMAFMSLSEALAFSVALSMCLLYVSLGSNVSPRIFGC